MQLGPSLYQSSLPTREAPSEQLYKVKAVNSLVISMVGMKMGQVMGPQFTVHTDDNAVKATEFRHGYIDRAAEPAPPASRCTATNNRFTIADGGCQFSSSTERAHARFMSRSEWGRLKICSRVVTGSSFGMWPKPG
jgi:hypothetical protein